MTTEKPGKATKTTNVVHQNATWVETIHKEQRHQKLYTDFGINPFRRSTEIYSVLSKNNHMLNNQRAEGSSIYYVRTGGVGQDSIYFSYLSNVKVKKCVQGEGGGQICPTNA